MPSSLNIQKEQLSIAYVRAVAAAAGFTCTKPEVDDDSVDLIIAASGKFNERNVILSPRIELQLKATSSLDVNNECIQFPLPVKNYNDLRAETLVPRLLVVFIMPEQVSEWLCQSEEQLIIRRCAYWSSLYRKPDTSNTTSVTVSIPRSNVFSVEALKSIMEKVARREQI